MWGLHPDYFDALFAGVVTLVPLLLGVYPVAASPLNPWDIQLVVHLLSSLLLLSKMSKYVAGFGEMCRRILNN